MCISSLSITFYDYTIVVMDIQSFLLGFSISSYLSKFTVQYLIPKDPDSFDNIP